jgi:Family of unknown function (DUF5338)
MGASQYEHGSHHGRTVMEDGIMGTSSEKEAEAFVERLLSRLKDDPRAPLSGRYRAAFLAVQPLVEAALERGCTMKATWEGLRTEQRISMTYETFREHCRRLRGAERVTAPQAEPAPAARPRAQGPAAVSKDQTAPESSDAGRARGFQHERVPRKDEIY